MKDKLKLEFESTLAKYHQAKNVELIIDKIKEDTKVVLDKYSLSTNAAIYDIDNRIIGYEQEFPIEFENNLGRWRIEEDGTTYFQSIDIPKYITIDCTITKDGI